MKFLRLRVSNYRGLAHAEIAFSGTGITLVQGPNETGKSSLGESIGLLFEYPDSSKKQCIENIKPVHRDEGPEIELEAESGPYAFTYFKRFLKKPETRLSITRPRPENLTGRQAHERAEALLRETLDVDLWKALTLRQGVAIDQPVLSKQTSLSAALDQAAGGRSSDPREESLFERLKTEYLLYFTEKGLERKELADARKKESEAAQSVAASEAALAALELDIERANALQLELAQLAAQEAELKQSVAAHAGVLDEIAALENALNDAKLKRESAQKSEQAARREIAARAELKDGLALTERKLAELRAADTAAAASLNAVDAQVKAAQQALDDCDRKRKTADVLAALRRADFDYYNNKLHLEQLRERKERIDRARANAAQAEALLSRVKVDERALKAIAGAERALLTANAQLQTGAPRVLLRGLGACRLTVDGAETPLAAGAERALSVSERTLLAVPGMLEIEIAAGSSTEALTRKVDEARRALDAACATAGVADPKAAQQAHEERLEALRQVQALARVEAENLRDLKYDELDRRLRDLERSVPGYLAQRAAEPAICADLESAHKEREAAGAALQQSARAGESARVALDAVRELREGLHAKHEASRVQVDLLAHELAASRGKLERERATAPDEGLENALAAAVGTVAAETARVNAADASLRAKNPERIRALAETAQGSLQATLRRLKDAGEAQIQVRTRLKIHGEQGLYDTLQAARTELERRTTAVAALLRRAAAAKCLYETMRSARDRARRAYLAPLKQRIEQLGRLVFEETFQVEMDETLTIVSRTVNGRTVPFESLSGGAREQLGLIFRAACCMIVSPHGGMPLILDDALGYTDPERLQSMGAVLARAGNACQIVIFTCMPSRYRHVGDAKVVTI